MLLGRLSSAQSQLHKEAIRTAYMALAEHDMKIGNTNDAMGNLLRATEYCVSLRSFIIKKSISITLKRTLSLT